MQRQQSTPSTAQSKAQQEGEQVEGEKRCSPAERARAEGRKPRSSAATREAESCSTLKPFQSGRTTPAFSTSECTCRAFFTEGKFRR